MDWIHCYIRTYIQNLSTIQLKGVPGNQKCSTHNNLKDWMWHIIKASSYIA